LPNLTWDWIHTSQLEEDRLDQLRAFGGIWVVPASPYANTDGALAAIRLARESPLPFLGTCGGFQHAILEYARNVLHLHSAAHAELEADAAMPIVAPLRCSLVEKSARVVPVAGTRFASLYGEGEDEGYHCSFGLNPEYQNLFETGPFVIAAYDESGEVRAMEMVDHPFFVITLFQPERRGLKGRIHSVVNAFLMAANLGSKTS
jgi:CTP synthase (UTP-ammonia lyase)